MSDPTTPLPPDNPDELAIGEQASGLDKEAKESEPLTKRKPTYDEADIPDPDKAKKNDPQFFHEKLVRRETIDIENLQVYTPEGLIQKRDSHGERWLQPNFIYVFTGRTRSGKSYLLKQLMYYILKDPYWRIQWVEAYSGSGHTTDDLNFLHPKQIHEDYNDARLRYMLQSSHEQLKKLKAAGSEAELERGICIIDDQIGSLTNKETNMRGGTTAATWRFLATRGKIQRSHTHHSNVTTGRRLPITEIVLTQNFQWLLNYVRDGCAYLFCVSVSGSQFDYLWDQVMHHSLWENKRAFREWCSSYLTQYQVIVFNMHATEAVDLITVVKAQQNFDTEFRFYMADAYEEHRTLTRERARNKIEETERAFRRVRDDSGLSD